MASTSTARALRTALGLLFSAALIDGITARPALGVDTFFSGVQAVGAVTDPVAIVAGDVDRDGKTDLVAASSNASGATADIVLFRRNGASYTASTVDSTFDNAVDVEVGDLDRDGKLDIVASSSTLGVFWWKGNGAGGFAARVAIDGTFTHGRIALADFDRDGELEIFGVDPTTNRVWVFGYLGGGSVAFCRPAVTPCGPVAPVDVAVGDVTGDGFADLVTAGNGGGAPGIWLLPRYGPLAGAVFDAVPVATGDFTSVALADGDGDGDLDIFANRGGGSFVTQMFRNDGGGSFTPFSIGSFHFDGRAIAVGDLDLDGDADAVVSSIASGADRVGWSENVNGHFDSVTGTDVREIDNAYAAQPLLLADLDGDGDLDVAAGSQGVDNVSWWRNETIHRSVTFPAAVTAATIGAINPQHGVAAGDLDGDGDLDLIYDDRSSLNTVWLENDGSLDFGGWPSHLVGPSLPIGSWYLETADLDRDGDLDLVAFGEFGRLGWFENDGTPGDGTWTFHQLADATGDGHAYQAAVADIDGDGDLDIAYPDDNANRIRWLANDGTPGDGGWVLQNLSSASATSRYSAVALADLDGDGDIDGVFSNAFGLYWNEWDATIPGFVPHVVSNGINSAAHIRCADIDGDGDMDVLASPDVGATPTGLHLYRKNGATYDHSVIDGSLVADFRLADVDRDGDLDVVVGNYGTLHWYENQGAGSFTFHGEIAAQLPSIAVADLDRDGAPDIVGAAPNSVLVMRNRGGQIALPTVSTAPALLPQGAFDDILRIRATHRGRAGEGDEELAVIELGFEASEGVPMSFNDVSFIVDDLRVYRDANGNGIFDPGTDTLVSMDPDPWQHVDGGGKLAIVLPDGDASTKIAATADEDFFVAMTIGAGPAALLFPRMLVTHLTDSSSQGQDARNDAALRLEWSPNVTAVVCNDNAAPTIPVPTSTSHTAGVWSKDRTIDFSWSSPSDPGAGAFAGAGVAGYSVGVSSPGIPIVDNTIDVAQGVNPQTYTTGSLADGVWHFVVRAADLCGNWSGGSGGVAEYWIDGTQPNPASNLGSASHPVGVGVNDRTIDLSWTAGTDGLSGVAGYEVIFDTSGTTPCTGTVTTAATSYTSPTLPGGDYTARLCTVDIAGNVSTQVSSGLLIVDWKFGDGFEAGFSGWPARNPP